ncbi:SHOCT domain-containing protein [Natrialba swarupiae]|uniref:SHOCT domain-containing protein n=1 Tax=Natrialba swarupiae TaxID=2448032 RepID=A0A5D5ANH0_9EURY|nr:SHOCT domain-containing protein [Natrialba swarupiae]TYT60641.1 SHOCT domain-containing protein [Natrialba swarupiae]
MAEDSDDGYSLAELFVLKFVLADVLIIFVLLFAGVWYAIGLAALFVVSTFLVWYLTNRDPPRPEAATVGASETADTAVDPVTKLQNRYAAGELSEAEFEAKLEWLIDANERAERAGIETEELELERSN